MTSSVYAKIQIGADLRRIQLKKDLDLPAFKAYVGSLHGPQAASAERMTIKYRDSDGDLVTLGSTEEFKLFVEEAFQKKDTPQRLFVTFDQAAPASGEPEAATASAAAPPSAEPPRAPTPPPPAPINPAEVIASVLSDAEAVRCLQNAVASPAMNDAVIQVAQGFVASGPLGAWSAVTQAVPMARAVLEEAVDGNPALCEARQKLLEAGIDMADIGTCMRFARRGLGCHRGGRGPHHHHPHHRHGFHPWVVCDGCSADAELKTQSVSEGFHNGRGWISGPRFKSLTVDDFDLCQVCMNSGKFSESHGPFETVNREARHRWGGMGPRPPAPCAPPRPHFAHAASSHQPHHQPCNPSAGLGSMPFFEWARHHHQQQQQNQQASAHPGHQARGCRGSRRDLFSNLFREVVAQGATTVEKIAKENDNDDLATLARAFSESFRVPNSAPSAPATASGAQEAKPEAGSTPEASAEEKKVASETQASDEEEWEVPDVSPGESEDPFVKWQAALQQLALLGFTESEKYIEFLEEEDGSLERVVNRIVRRAA